MRISLQPMPHPSGIFYSAAIYPDRNRNTNRYDSIWPRHIQGISIFALLFSGTFRCRVLGWNTGFRSYSCGSWRDSAYPVILSVCRENLRTHKNRISPLPSWSHRSRIWLQFLPRGMQPGQYFFWNPFFFKSFFIAKWLTHRAQFIPQGAIRFRSKNARAEHFNQSRSTKNVLLSDNRANHLPKLDGNWGRYLENIST